MTLPRVCSGDPDPALYGRLKVVLNTLTLRSSGPKDGRVVVGLVGLRSLRRWSPTLVGEISDTEDLDWDEGWGWEHSRGHPYLPFLDPD